ncbi:MAG TPA: Z1 domain-containing protein [Gammaproteobacteria bacterium]
MQVIEGRNSQVAFDFLLREIQDSTAVAHIKEKAKEVLSQSVDPIGGPPEHPSDGLLYGLIQSGKTSVITAVAALAVDNSFDCVVILTSDIVLLYDQTLTRIREGLPGIAVLGKDDWIDPSRFERNIRTTPFVIVCSKNNSKLTSLLDAFRSVGRSGAKGLSTLIIDDEADHASLNTKASKKTAEISSINRAISDFRSFFPTNTYLQVTATPQALFLQSPDHRYRPSFTVLSKPGSNYVGGEVFFGEDSTLLRYVNASEIEALIRDSQPTPISEVPKGLRSALFTYLVGASARVSRDPTAKYAFLCHVSLKKLDHKFVVDLIDRFKEEVIRKLSLPATDSTYRKLVDELQSAYVDLKETEPTLPSFDDVVESLRFYIRGANIRIINATTKDEVSLDSVFNIFVGGNKLGRGVTIERLIVSYYGRNAKRPNADTVLQHARMYGYRKKDQSITRLFLPEELADRFRSIHQMESALRGLIETYPNSKLEGLFVVSPLQATRRNVLDPDEIGLYVAGRMYNPRYPKSAPTVEPNTRMVDAKVENVRDGQYIQCSIDDVIEVVEACIPDESHGGIIWRRDLLRAALEKLKTLNGDEAYIYVSRGRRLAQPRRETQGVHDSQEDKRVPSDKPALFLFRKEPSKPGEVAAWWPQLRFPVREDQNYVLAFNLS